MDEPRNRVSRALGSFAAAPLSMIIRISTFAEFLMNHRDLLTNCSIDGELALLAAVTIGERRTLVGAKMSAWSESHWIDYDAEILNLFAADTAWIEYRYSIGNVGWRRIRGDSPGDVSRVLEVAAAAKQGRSKVRVRVTNSGGPGGTAEITAIQTL